RPPTPIRPMLIVSLAARAWTAGTPNVARAAPVDALRKSRRVDMAGPRVNWLHGSGANPTRPKRCQQSFSRRAPAGAFIAYLLAPPPLSGLCKNTPLALRTPPAVGILAHTMSARAFALMFATAGSVSAAEPVDYVRDIKPILAKNCYSCHGANKQS